MAKSGTEHTALFKAMDILFGVAVMGTVGTLIGVIMGGGLLPLASGAGLLLGGIIGFMGGRRFLVSVPIEEQLTSPIMIRTGWTALLGKR